MLAVLLPMVLPGESFRRFALIWGKLAFMLPGVAFRRFFFPGRNFPSGGLAAFV
jgi:hypothetical protein